MLDESAGRVATHAAAAVDGGDRRRPNVAASVAGSGAIVLAQLVVEADDFAGRSCAVHSVVVGA